MVANINSTFNDRFFFSVAEVIHPQLAFHNEKLFHMKKKPDYFYRLTTNETIWFCLDLDLKRVVNSNPNMALKLL